MGAMYDIFFNYRRSQAVTVAALVAQMRHRFGQDKVFLDLSMPSGSRYPDYLRTRVRTCEVLVVVIHPEWLLEFEFPREKDWVLEEIRTALDLGKPVIPLLLEGTPMPAANQLPAEIRELALMNAEHVRAISLTSDLERLAQRLAQQVEERYNLPARTIVDHPPRTTFRILFWAIVFSVGAFAVFYQPAPLWRQFAFAAATSTVLMVVVALLAIVPVVALAPLEARWQRRVGAVSHNKRLREAWLAPALILLATSYVLVLFITKGGVQEWKIWYVVTLLTTAAYFMHRSWRRLDPADQDWPPPVTTDLLVFSRAAHRLDEKLSADLEWQVPRSRMIQRQAVTIYLELAQVRVAINTRSKLPLVAWVTRRYSGQSTIMIGWFLSILALNLAAAIVMVTYQAPPAVPVRQIGLAPIIAGITMIATVLTEWLLDRRRHRRYANELEQWQHKLGPRIFCTHDASCEISDMNFKSQHTND